MDTGWRLQLQCLFADGVSERSWARRWRGGSPVLHPLPGRGLTSAMMAQGRWYPHFHPDLGAMLSSGLVLPREVRQVEESDPRKSILLLVKAQPSCPQPQMAPSPDGKVCPEITPAKRSSQLKCRALCLPFRVCTWRDQVILIQQQKVVTLPITSCMSSSRFFNQSVPQCPHL